MKFIVVVLLCVVVGDVMGKIVRVRRDNSYGDELVTPSGAGEVHEGATESSEGSGAAVESGSTSAPSSSASGSSPSDSGSAKGAGYAAESGGEESPKEHAPVAVEQATQKSPSQQPSGYRK